MSLFLRRIKFAWDYYMRGRHRLAAIPAPEEYDFVRDQQERRRRATSQLPALPAAARLRFPDKVLVNLVDAGWHEGRQWDPRSLEEFEAHFGKAPPLASKILLEFGGLAVGFGNRTITFGLIDDQLGPSRQVLDSLLGTALYPVGLTNILEDDGLGVHVDGQGRLFVDGRTGFDPPQDYRMDLLGHSMDDALGRLFAGGAITWPTLIDGPTSWYYTEADLPKNR